MKSDLTECQSECTCNADTIFLVSSTSFSKVSQRASSHSASPALQDGSVPKTQQEHPRINANVISQKKNKSHKQAGHGLKHTSGLLRLEVLVSADQSSWSWQWTDRAEAQERDKIQIHKACHKSGFIQTKPHLFQTRFLLRLFHYFTETFWNFYRTRETHSHTPSQTHTHRHSALSYHLIWVAPIVGYR